MLEEAKGRNPAAGCLGATARQQLCPVPNTPTSNPTQGLTGEDAESISGSVFPGIHKHAAPHVVFATADAQSNLDWDRHKKSTVQSRARAATDRPEFGGPNVRAGMLSGEGRAGCTPQHSIPSSAPACQELATQEASNGLSRRSVSISMLLWRVAGAPSMPALGMGNLVLAQT